MSDMIYSYRRKETSGHTQTKWCGAAVSKRLRQFVGPHGLRGDPSLKLTRTALLPVEPWQAVVTLGSRGAFSALTEARAVAPVVDRTHLIAVTFWKKGKSNPLTPRKHPHPL